jgi:hypothetical protein
MGGGQMSGMPLLLVPILVANVIFSKMFIFYGIYE